MLSRLDQNKDGNVTRDEVDAYIDALFNGADGDKDGGLTLGGDCAKSHRGVPGKATSKEIDDGPA